MLKTRDPRERWLLPTSEHRPSLTTTSSPSTSRAHLCPSRSPVGLWKKPAFSPNHHIDLSDLVFLLPPLQQTPEALPTCRSVSRAAPTLLAPRPPHTLAAFGNSLSSLPIAELLAMAANPNFKSQPWPPPRDYRRRRDRAWRNVGGYVGRRWCRGGPLEDAGAVSDGSRGGGEDDDSALVFFFFFFFCLFSFCVIICVQSHTY